MNVLGLALANCNCPSAPFEIMQASHRFFRDTGLTNGSTVGVVGLNTGVANGAAAGWEVDSSTDPAAYGNAGCLDSDCSFITPTLPAGHIVLASAQCCNPAEIVTYPHPDGGLVFSAGSVLFGGSLAVDAQLQHIVGNVLDEALGFVCPPLPDGLIAWWRGEGNVEDFTGANPGTLSGSVTFAPGKVGQAFNFSGADGYVALPANVFPFPANGTANVPMSFECWFKTSIQGVILGQQTSAPYTSTVSAVPAIYIGSDNLLRVEMFWNGSPAPITISNNVADGIFHHVAVVYDGTNQTVYLDSNLAGTAPHTQTAYRNGPYLYQLGTGCTPTASSRAGRPAAGSPQSGQTARLE